MGMAYQERELLRRFEAQFEEERGVILYRRSRKAAPIIVTAAERAGFINEFQRASQRLKWKWMADAFVVSILLAVIAVHRDGLGAWLADFLHYAHMFVGALVAYWQSEVIWDAPVKALAMRAPVGGPREGTPYLDDVILHIPWHFHAIYGLIGFGGLYYWLFVVKMPFANDAIFMYCVFWLFAVAGLALFAWKLILTFDKPQG